VAGKRDWGRIRQLPSGRWQARYPGPDGKLRPAPDTFERRKQASDWLADKQTEILREEWTDPEAGKVPFRDFAWSWLKERKLAETTYERYEGILRNHVEPILGDKPLVEIKEGTIRRWRAQLLDNGVGEPTVAKAYRMLHAIFATAADDMVIRRNPCRIKGAGQDSAPERTTLTIDQVFGLADAIRPRYRVLVLLAAFTSLRFGEFAALRRRDVDLVRGELWVRRSQAELKHGRTVIKGPKTEAGKRRVSIPGVVMADLRRHVDTYTEDGPDGLVFIGPEGGRLRRRNFHRLWVKALVAVNLDGEDIHFHDLRHTGNELAADAGATTKDLMARMGHSTMRAALIYQHASRTRDQRIADAISANVNKARQPMTKVQRKRARRDPKGHARGTSDEQAS
jgi:integrase